MRGFVVWLTGLPASGKTTIARKLEEKLQELGWDTEVLDGDELRKGLSQDLGFSKEDRLKHGRRVAYLAKMLAKHGVAVIVSLVSPYRAMRDYARNLIEKFIEVYVKCSVETCMKRDPKGLYKKAVRGEIKNFTGISDPYEEPENPEVIVDTEKMDPEQCVQKILEKLTELKYIA